MKYHLEITEVPPAIAARLLADAVADVAVRCPTNGLFTVAVRRASVPELTEAIFALREIELDGVTGGQPRELGTD